jgi:D-xylulose kinase
MPELFLGVDSGTQGTKAVVLDSDSGRILSQGHARHELLQDDRGTREQEPAWWIKACEQAIGMAIGESGEPASAIRAIGVSGQQHGFVPLDAQHKVIRPAKLWCDTATTDQADRITAALGGVDQAIQKTGNAIAVGYTASKILWMKENEPEAYDRLATALLPHDFINFWLTGEHRSECGDASGTGYFNIRERRWSREVLDAIDASGKLHGCMPEMTKAGEAVGTVRPDIARQFGFSPDVLVSPGGGDNMMAAIGTGNVMPGVVTASLGTSGTIFSFSEQPVVDELGEVAAFCSSDGHWLPLVCTMNVTVSTELTRSLLNLDVDRLNKKVGASPPGAQGLLLLPYFNAERTPALPRARATLHGMSSSNFNPENVCRAAMEGATLGLRYGLDAMRRHGIEADEIRLTGGGAKSAVWRQIVADIFDCPVVCPQTSEAAALGAALQAMWCYLGSKEGEAELETICREFVRLDESTRALPQVSHVALYNDVYSRYLKLNDAMKAMY